MIGMVDVVHEPIDDEQAEMHVWPPVEYCGFDLEHAVPIQQIFGTLPIECKCDNDGGMVTVHYFCQFSSTPMWIIVD